MYTFQRCDGVKAHRIFQMIWCKVRISHRHFDVGMAEYTLQDQNITTIHHKVAGEGMAQNVGKLSCR